MVSLTKRKILLNNENFSDDYIKRSVRTQDH